MNIKIVLLLVAVCYFSLVATQCDNIFGHWICVYEENEKDQAFQVRYGNNNDHYMFELDDDCRLHADYTIAGQTDIRFTHERCDGVCGGNVMSSFCAMDSYSHTKLENIGDDDDECNHSWQAYDQFDNRYVCVTVEEFFDDDF
eukprot:TRINITY_DN321_c0_g1_i7.p1 TRINITY_DN321_c0_g1~~TRINITY_DN321_c0_g1_i7.p1  ORF type:complete len:143 (-),score=35.42 TRINITY_DN321_c0_g1_i7:60-488(-)